ACEQSPPRRVKEVPTEAWNNPPYQHGTQVTYRCRPGYIKYGRILFECDDGEWKQRRPLTECRNKPCGHPGDTEFGSFQLTSGNEFVFGARVEYRCNDGYQMLSQKNYRECLADGWSNDIPHCEVAKCLPVKAPENGRIVMTGAFELNQEYSFGQVVEFECNKKYRLVGSKEIHCSSDGRWDSDVPRCQDIICNVPAISHGFVRNSKSSYKESEQLQFGCEEGYTFGERADALCTESGWHPTPYCTEILCSPPRVPNGIFRPQENSYREGAMITIDCNPGYHLRTLSGKNTAQCTSRGWVPAPDCVEKPCDYPVIENGKISERMAHSYFPMRIGQYVDYHCRNGYLAPNGERVVRIYCSKGGWNPEPKCLKTCSVTHLENGYFRYNRYTYTEGERIQYVCNQDYRTESEGGEVTCTKNGWSPFPRCIRKKTCKNIVLDNASFLSARGTFGLQAKVTYTCHDGFVTPEGKDRGETRCQENGWTPTPKCIRSCRKPDVHILDDHVDKSVFLPGDTIAYSCSEGFQTADNMATGTTSCEINGEWKPAPRCLEIECEIPIVPNGYISPREDKYSNGDVVNFFCKKKYERVGPASAQCYYFGWSPSPPTCKENPRGCGPPPEITNGSIAAGSLQQYQHGSRTEYECDTIFKLVGSKEIECVDGQWSPPPSCIEDKTPCGSPSSIPDIVLHQQDQLEFSHGDEILYGCKKGNAGSMRTKCLNGEWKPLPLCDAPSHRCVTPVDVEVVQPSYFSEPKKETEPRGVIQYKCTSADNNIKEATCVSGKWSPEINCTGESTCPPPPQLHGAKQIPAERNYKNGSKIIFSCLESFQLIGGNEITCINGRWQSPPRCVENPCLPPQPVEYVDDLRLENQNLKMEKEGKTIYLAGATLNVVCRPGYTLDGPSKITCSMGNWTSAPTCSERPCGSIPAVANAAFEGRSKEKYEPGETVRYQCHEGFQVTGPPEIFCRRGNWSTPPICEDVRCGPPPEIFNAHITSPQQQRYLPGATVHYECESNSQIMGVNYVTCSDGHWTKVPSCRDVTCEPPPEIAGGKVQGVKKPRYLPGETAHYQCWQGFQMMGASTVTCQNGTWTERPQCKGKGRKCGPPPDIENGDILSFPLPEYDQGQTVKYKCPSFYILKGPEQITCIDGQWTNPPVCLAACTASEEDMDRNNIELRWRGERKLYSTSGDFIEFDCQIGYVQDPASSPFRVQCMDGTLEYPWCKPGRNCSLSETAMKRNNIKLRHSRKRSNIYRSKETILFECNFWFQEVSNPEDFEAQCHDGVINYPQCECKCS
ncbi:CFAH factor, partial [Asarcornis scutulata]|nr:CFAH factor [Asarcornis scutulata]